MRLREYLSKREQQIMELVFRHDRLTATEIQAGLPGDPANSSVRTMLTILEKKGWLSHEAEGIKYVYYAARPRHEAATSAVHGVLETFFKGSVGDLVASLLSDREVRLSDADIAEMKELIARAEAEAGEEK